MKIDPPIRYAAPGIAGHIVEMDEESGDCILQTESGQRITLRGDQQVVLVGPRELES